MKDIPTWRMKHLASTTTHLPAVPGLYVIGHEELVNGLMIGREYVYVGKTSSVRRRLEQHTHLTELHPDLATYLRKNRARARIWYTTDIDPADIDSVERELVRKLDTKYNRIKYSKSRGGK